MPLSFLENWPARSEDREAKCHGMILKLEVLQNEREDNTRRRAVAQEMQSNGLERKLPGG